MKRLRLIMADDHALVLAGLRKLLETECDVVSVVEDGRALVAAAEEFHPDVILMDISMPLLNGIDAARQIRRASPKSKMIFVTMHADADYVREALSAGASGYLLKRSAASELLPAIHSVFNGGTYITPILNKHLPGLMSAPDQECRSCALTPRQREVLQLVAEGRAMKEIAYILRVSTKTVEYHKNCIGLKLGTRTTAGLTKYAIDNGIIAH
jgi:DNA-binding NarL/FixJ family response regulator